MKFGEKLAAIFGFRFREIPFYRDLALATVAIFASIYLCLDLLGGAGFGHDWKGNLVWCGILIFCFLATPNRRLILIVIIAYVGLRLGIYFLLSGRWLVLIADACVLLVSLFWLLRNIKYPSGELS